MAKPLETFLTEPGTVLAFDFGLARTGVAVGNTVTRTAEPLVILDASTNESRWQSIEALMSEWKPKFLVVGVPRLGTVIRQRSRLAVNVSPVSLAVVIIYGSLLSTSVSLRWRSPKGATTLMIARRRHS